MFLTRRVITAEHMDSPTVSESDQRATLLAIRQVNRWLGGTGQVLGALRPWLRTMPRGSTLRVLDLGTGSADIPIALARWSVQAGLAVQIIGLDLHPLTLALAREQIDREPAPVRQRIELVQADALKPPFARQSFDFVISSMFLHHLPDIEVLTALKIMDDLSRRGLVWNDLLRNRWSLTWAHLLTLGRPATVRHDATVSVRAGFTRREVREICDRMSFGRRKVTVGWGYRFTVAVAR
jgi:SAM-dependent methyltransferase